MVLAGRRPRTVLGCLVARRYPVRPSGLGAWRLPGVSWGGGFPGRGPGGGTLPGVALRRPVLLAAAGHTCPSSRPGSRAHSSNLAESQNIPGWLEAPAQALGYPFHTFIGGHLTRLGTRDNVVIQQEYAADLKAQAASAIDTFNVADVYKSVDPTNPWAIFRGYLDGVAAQAANAVVPRWIDRLGGADVYTLANAYELVESLRIDYGHLGPFGIHP